MFSRFGLIKLRSTKDITKKATRCASQYVKFCFMPATGNDFMKC